MVYRDYKHSSKNKQLPIMFHVINHLILPKKIKNDEYQYRIAEIYVKIFLLVSVHNTISLSHHEQVCLIRL